VPRYPDNVLKIQATEEHAMQGSFVSEAEAAAMMGTTYHSYGDDNWPECGGFCKAGAFVLDREQPRCCRVTRSHAHESPFFDEEAADDNFYGKGRVYCWR
jgi:hypothetical protein